jgi:hypothetical protein
VADQAAQALHDRRALTVTLLSLDPIKGALADVLGLGGEDWSKQVGDAAAEVVFRLAATVTPLARPSRQSRRSVRP